MIQKKKEINKNWLYSIIFVALFVLGVFLGFRNNMLKVGATAFPNSNITYNEGQILTNSTDTYMNIYYDNANSKYTVIMTRYAADAYGINQAGSGFIYTNCTYNNSKLTCSGRYSYNSTSSGNLSYSTLGVNPLTINTNNVTTLSNVYTIVSTGYTEDQYLAYGQQQYNTGYNAGIAYVQAHPAEYSLYTAEQYNANYTAGQNSVINSPNTYGLYTQAQYEANYTSGYNAGIAYVQAHPSDYNLYTASQYTDYGTAQYNAGIAYVQANPSQYNLYTASQYNSYGSSQFTAGESAVTSNPNDYNLYTSQQYADNYTAGQNSVINNPNNYGLYTQAQYDYHGQVYYNNGYNTGLHDNTASYNAGILYVVNHPSEYYLYTTDQYNAYGTQQYNAGIAYVQAHPNDYNLYTTDQYNAYYQAGYQAGITQGETNVTTNPNDYDLYTAQQYENSFSYEDYISNLFDQVWVDQPTWDSQHGYYRQNWVKINNNLVTISNGVINLDNVYSTYSNITDVMIVFKQKFNSYIPLYINNKDTSHDYSKIEVGLECYNDTSNPLKSNWRECYVFPDYSLTGITANSALVPYSSLINENNYFYTFDYGVDDGINDYHNVQYNAITIKTFNTDATNLLYLDGYVNEIKFDLSVVNVDSYNTGYNAGYEQGKVIQSKAQYNSGYNDGYEDASELYSVTDGNANTLVGLAGTIIFSPVNMLKQIFDFNFLGVNLAGFILSIITLIVVAWLIKRLI